MPLSSTQGLDLLEHRIHKDSSTFVLHAVVEVRIPVLALRLVRY